MEIQRQEQKRNAAVRP